MLVILSFVPVGRFDGRYNRARTTLKGLASADQSSDEAVVAVTCTLLSTNI